MCRFSDAGKGASRGARGAGVRKAPRQEIAVGWAPGGAAGSIYGGARAQAGSIGLLSLNHWQNRPVSATLIRSNSCADALRRWKSEAPALSLKTAAGRLARR